MSTKEILQQIHDEADHIIGYEDDNKLQIAVLNARVIKRLAKQALRPEKPVKLYQGTSESIGTQVLVVKAENAKQASKIVRDVIEENHMTADSKVTIYILELVQPENNGPGYCYPKEGDDKFRYTL